MRSRAALRGARRTTGEPALRGRDGVRPVAVDALRNAHLDDRMPQVDPRRLVVDLAIERSACGRAIRHLAALERFECGIHFGITEARAVAAAPDVARVE